MKLFRYALGLVLFAIVFTACGPVTQQNQVLCPLNYGASQEDCKYAAQDPNDGNHQFLPALELQQNQVAIYRPSGDRAVVFVTGIGYHEVPDKYSTKWPTDSRLLRTEGDPAAKCSAEIVANHECDTTLTGVLLMGGTKAILDFQLEYQLVINQQNATKFATNFNGYADFMDKFNKFVRDQFRNAPTVDPALYTNGDIKAALATYYKTQAETWEYSELIEIKAVGIREFEIPGISTGAVSIQQSQGEQQASAYATQQSIACGDYTEEAWRAYCQAVYVWYLKNDGSAAPVPPVDYPGPVPSAVP